MQISHFNIKIIEIKAIYETLWNFELRYVDSRLYNVNRNAAYKLVEKRKNIENVLSSIINEAYSFVHSHNYSIIDFIEFQQESIKKLNEFIESNNYFYFIQDIINIRSFCEELITLSRAMLHMQQNNEKWNLDRHEAISQDLPKLFE